MSKFSQILLAIILLPGGVVFIQYKHSVKLSDERDRYKQNNTALLSDIERIKVDSTTMAVDAKALRLTIDEYERFRAADAEKIRQMGVKIKNLQAAAKHQLAVKMHVQMQAAATPTVQLKQMPTKTKETMANIQAAQTIAAMVTMVLNPTEPVSRKVQFLPMPANSRNPICLQITKATKMADIRAV